MFSDLADLIKSYGPGMAPWVLLFILIVFITGKGGRAAMNNVTTIMREGEELRGRMRQSLKECDEQLQMRDKVIRELTADIETARVTFKRMRAEMAVLEEQVLELSRQLRREKRKTDPNG